MKLALFSRNLACLSILEVEKHCFTYNYIQNNFYLKKKKLRFIKYNLFTIQQHIPWIRMKNKMFSGTWQFGRNRWDLELQVLKGQFFAMGVLKIRFDRYKFAFKIIFSTNDNGKSPIGSVFIILIQSGLELTCGQ